MIPKWRNLVCGTFVRNIVGLFVALILWGTHVHGKRPDNRAVIPRHTPYFSSKTNIFGVNGNAAHQWVNFINPASSVKRDKQDDVLFPLIHSSTESQENHLQASPTDQSEIQTLPTSAVINSESDAVNVVFETSSTSTRQQNGSVKSTDVTVESAIYSGDSSGGKSKDVVKNANEIASSTMSVSFQRDDSRNDATTIQTNTFSSGSSISQNGDFSKEVSTVLNHLDNKVQLQNSRLVLGDGKEVVVPVSFVVNNDVISKKLNKRTQNPESASLKPPQNLQFDRIIGQENPHSIIYQEIVGTVSSGSALAVKNNLKRKSSADDSPTMRSAQRAHALTEGSSARTNNMWRMRMERQATAQEEAAEMIPACRRFVEGNPDKGEFFSPNFPSNYPNNTDCIKVLAASPGHLLRLDFRDEFHIEPSEGCRFDYLQVRDGAHGYENLIGTFCGREFPPMMTSSGRYLWLRFHSDENIEYKGFSAVYESIARPANEDHMELSECVINVGGSEGFIRSADIDAERRRIAAFFNLTLECMWIIRVKPGWRIQLSFLKFELAKPNDCVSNFVDVFSDRTDMQSLLKSFCGSIADMVTSDTHILHVRFLAETKAINSSFEALFTAFRDSKVSACTKDEFDCQDETCISGELRCNQRMNCRFRWDEDECQTKISQLEKILSSDHIIIILVVFSLIMFGMCFAFVFNCVRKLMHDHKIIQENFRQSREGRLDEIGIKLPSSPRGVSVVHRSRSNSSSAERSLSPRHRLHNGHADSSEEPPPGTGQECYVPSGGDLLPILPRHHAANGDAVFPRDASDDEAADELEMSNFPPPEMRDSECQTRESLFMNTNSDRSITPPPPPPPTSRGHHHHHHQNNRPVGQFSTFGYNRDNRRDVALGETPPPPKDYSTMPHPPTARNDPRYHRPYATESQRFRAEAVIEMEGGGGGGGDEKRPFSVDSSKSAPDVIVTH